MPKETQHWLSYQISTHTALQLFQLFRQGAAIIIIILFTKSSLSLEAIGGYEMVLYVGVTFSFFWVNGLLQGLLPVYPNLEEAQQKSFFFNSYLLFVGFTLVVFFLLFFGEAWVLKLLVGQDHLPYFKLYCYFLLLNLPAYLVEYIYLLKEEASKIIAFGLFAFGGQVLAVVLPVFLLGDLALSFQCLIALAAIKHLWLLVLLFKYAKPTIDKILLSEYFFLALPLMAYAFLGGFSQAFDQWLVNWKYDGDESTFAIFRNGARELPLTVAVMSALNATMIPSLSKNLEIGIAALKKKTVQLCHFLFPISILLLLTSKQFFPFVFNTDFIASVPIFNIYMLMLISRIFFPHTIIIAQKDTKLILWVSICEISFNALLSFILVQYYGLVGIVFATFVALLLEKFAFMWIVFKKYNLRPGQYTNMKVIIGYSMALLLVYFWVTF